MSVTVDQMIGKRVQERREALGLSQSQLGALLGEYFEKPWPRQTISTAEKGERHWRAVELAALTEILNVDEWWLAPGEELTFPSGRRARVSLIELGPLSVDMVDEITTSILDAWSATNDLLARLHSTRRILERARLPQNEEEARAVLEELADQGDEEARQALERLNERT